MIVWWWVSGHAYVLSLGLSGGGTCRTGIYLVSLYILNASYLVNRAGTGGIGQRGGVTRRGRAVGRDSCLCCCRLLLAQDRLLVPAKTRCPSWCCSSGSVFIVSCQKGALHARRVHCAKCVRHQPAIPERHKGTRLGQRSRSRQMCVCLGCGGKAGKGSLEKGGRQ